MEDFLNLDDEGRSNLGVEIENHLQNIDTVLGSKRDKWDKYIALYKAVRNQETKDFPWPGCSNVFVPELFNQVTTIASFLLMNTIRQNPPYTVKAYFRDKEEVKMAAALEQFLAFYTTKVQNHVSYWRKCIPYLCLLGTHVVKLGFEDKGRLGWPEVTTSPMNLHRIYAYPGVTDYQNAPFIADISWVSPAQLYMWADQGLITETMAEELLEQLATINGQNDVFETHRHVAQAIPPGYLAMYDVYMMYQAGDRTKRPQRVRVVFERQTRTVLWTEDWAEKPLPYEFVYFRQDEDDLFGLGLGDYLFTLQESVNTSVNQAIDNATLANTRMLVAPPNSGLKAGDRIYPGRIIVTNMGEKVKPWQMGDIYPSSLNMINLEKQIMQTVSGASDSMQGMPDMIAKTRHTFSGQMTNLQQGAGKLDLSSAELEDGLTNIVWHTLGLLAAYAAGFEFKIPIESEKTQDLLEKVLGGRAQGGLADLLKARLDEDEAEQIEELIFKNSEQIIRRERFEILPSHRFSNKETERQAAIMLSQLITQYLSKIVEMAMLIMEMQGKPGTELLVNTLTNAWESANRAMKRVLISFSVEEAADILVELEEVMNGIGPALGASTMAAEPSTGGEPGMAFDQYGTGPEGSAGAPFGALGG